MAKTYTDWGDKAKHSISFAQHKKNVAAKAGGGGGGGGLPDAARVTARARKDPAFLVRALQNPGLRSRITDVNLLPKDLRQKRLLEQRLNAPVAPGSSMTGRDLAHQAAAETTAAYAIPEGELGQQLKSAQQHQTDVGGWWDQYQAAVNAGAAKVGAAQDQMVGGAGGVAQGIQGLGQAQIGGILNQAVAGAMPGTTPSASLATEANRAQVARETLAGSYLGQAQQQAGATKGLAEYQAGTVAPGYRVQGLTTAQRDIDAVRGKQSALATKKGADLLKTRADIRQQELANTVALGQLTNQTITARTSAAANSPAGRAADAGLDVDKTNAAKAGVSLKTWQGMTPAQQAKASRAMNPPKQDDLDKAITDPKDPFFGLTPRQIARHSQTWRDQRIKHSYGLTHKPGKDGKDGKGGDWVTQEQMGAALTQLTGLKSAATKAKTGQLFEPPKGGQKKPGIGLDRHGAAKKILAFGPIAAKLKDPILVTAALDAVYDGHLSPATVRGLIAAKYQPGRVAKALGVPTAGKLPRRRAPTPGEVGQAGDTAARTVKSVV